MTVRSQAGRTPSRLQRVDRGEPGDDAGRAVEIAAVRHAVEMRADDHPLRRPVAPRPGHVEIGRRVPRDLEAEVARRPLDGRVRALLAGAVRVARDTRRVQAVAAQRVEQPGGEGAARRHR